jgi:hypothetical protein
MRKYLTSKEVAELRRKSESSLSQERKRGTGPPYIHDGGRVLYPADELQEWLDDRTIRDTDPPTRGGGTE